MSDHKADVDTLFQATYALSAVTSELTYLTETISNSVETWDGTSADGCCFLLYRVRDDVEAQSAALSGAMKALNTMVAAQPKETSPQTLIAPA